MQKIVAQTSNLDFIVRFYVVCILSPYTWCGAWRGRWCGMVQGRPNPCCPTSLKMPKFLTVRVKTVWYIFCLQFMFLPVIATVTIFRTQLYCMLWLAATDSRVWPKSQSPKTGSKSGSKRKFFSCLTTFSVLEYRSYVLVLSKIQKTHSPFNVADRKSVV